MRPTALFVVVNGDQDPLKAGCEGKFQWQTETASA